jgi:hypothetical protein
VNMPAPTLANYLERPRIMGERDAAGRLEEDDPFVHIVFPNSPHVALCGKEVRDSVLVGDDEGPECPACAAQEDWWRSLEP